MRPKVLRPLIAVLLALASSVAPVVAAESAADKIKAGRAALIAENPQAALESYRAALTVLPPDARADRFAALIGVGRSAAWLEQYALAERSYREALGLAGSDEDRALAAAGLAEMLNIADRPRAAFGLSAPLASGSLANAVQAARAALTLGWEDKARGIVDSEASNVTPEIRETRVGRAFRAQQEELAFRTGPVLSSVAGYSKDSDDVRTYDVIVRAAMSPQHALPLGIRRWDVAARHQTVDEGTDRIEVPQLQGGLRFDPTADIRLLVNGGAAEADGWTYFVGDTQVAYRPSDEWGIEVSGEHDAVRTVTALQNRVRYLTASVGGDIRLANITFAGALFRQSFTDDNERDGWVGRVTSPSYLPFGPGRPAAAVQLYARSFTNSGENTIGYFNPDRYHEQRLNLILNARLSPSWVLRSVVGIGRESIDGERSSTGNADVKLSGRLGRSTRVDVSIRHGDSAAFSSSGVGYAQTSATVGLEFLL